MQLDPKALLEEAVQASIDAGLAVNGEHGVAAARHAARFMFNALQAVQPVPVVKGSEYVTRDSVVEALSYLEQYNGAGRKLDAYAMLVNAPTATASAEPVAWQSMDTAPKDGTRVLLWAKEWSGPLTGQYYGEPRGWGVFYDVAMMKYQPTHWQSLPAAPLPAQEGKADD